MSSKENNKNKQERSRTRRYVVTGEYCNAHYSRDQIEIKDGDVCTVRPGAPYKHGDIVLVECSNFCQREQTTVHYHALFYFRVNGKKWDFRLNTWKNNAGKFYQDGDLKIIIGAVARVIHQGQRREQKARARGTASYTAAFEWPLFGVHYNDEITVKQDGQARPGQLILVRTDDGSNEFFTRCCTASTETVRVCSIDGEAYDKPAQTVIGAAIEINHDQCNHTKAESLRLKVRELLDDNDHTLNITHAMEVEKEIYDLEHPTEEPVVEEKGIDDEWPDEWPEVIEDEK